VNPLNNYPAFLANPYLALQLLSSQQNIAPKLPLQTLPSGFQTHIPSPSVQGLSQLDLLNNHYQRNEKLIEIVTKNPNLSLITKYGPNLMQQYNTIVSEAKSRPAQVPDNTLDKESLIQTNSYQTNTKIETEQMISKNTAKGNPSKLNGSQSAFGFANKGNEASKKEKKEITKKAQTHSIKEKPKKAAPEPVQIIPPPLSEQAALQQLRDNYLKQEDESAPELVTFTKNFPGWHLDEIFDFLSKATPVEAVEVIKYSLYERDEKIRLAKEKEEQEIRDQQEDNKPRIRTRFWKQNQDNRRPEDIPIKPKADKKHQRDNFVLRLKQLVEIENIDEVKANQLLIKFNNDAKKALMEVKNNLQEYKLSLSL
jgi:hypothetical protein